jgi:hypothetical protein
MAGLLKNPRFVNSTASLFVFAISLATYLRCLEPSVSWWDCGEFIAASYGMEVGHPPGAPLFLLLGRIFTLLAPDPGKAAMMVNVLSALASALTVFFLYHTIVMLVGKAGREGNPSDAPPSRIAVIAGLAGALAYAFSDTFWFSAVEAEVYGLSSLFTAVVFWAILRWEREAGRQGSLRWILLIAYLMGLSIGVHLLNLLAIPAIVLIGYHRLHPEGGWKGWIKTVILSLGILAFILYGLIPGIPVLASWFELFFVNLVHLPYNSGLLIFILLLAGSLTFAIRESHRKGNVVMNTLFLALTFMITGYSSYVALMVRSAAQPPMNQDNPENVFNLTGYLNRDQYGDRPLISGPYYTAPITGRRPGKGVYGKVDGRYRLVDREYKPVYDRRFITVFPRMWHASPEHAALYRQWGRVKGRPVEVTDGGGKKKLLYRPTFAENLGFFFTYQVGHMYGRYFMWNFAGRQNDTQGQGGIRDGNWISGLPFIDNPRLGPQKELPERQRDNKSRNRYFLLPLLLGLAGAIYQYRRSRSDFRALLMLFLFTGVAIVVYLNQTPGQPRERDYSYAGSFYAFSVWIGMGAASLGGFGHHRERRGAWLAGAAALVVPAWMAVQNFDDHDRSGRYIAHDLAFDYLNSCAPDAILFTSGDNDTFPLWYLQEVEGVRTDVRVVCLPYLASDWYIDQLKRKCRLSDPVPFSLTRQHYGPGRHDYIPVIDQVPDTADLARVIQFVTDDRESAKIPLEGGGSINYLPAKHLSIPVDRDKVLANGTVPPEDAGKIVAEVKWDLNRQALYKNDLMVLDLIASNHWERPIYFTSPGGENTLGLNHYFRLDGLAYRLVPVYHPDSSGLSASINTRILYDRFMNEFKWGNLGDSSVLIDYYSYRTTLILRLREHFADLANALLREDRRDSALSVIDRIGKILPVRNFPYDPMSAGLAETCYRAGSFGRGNAIMLGYARQILQDIRYINSVEARFGPILSVDADNDLALISEIRRMADAWQQDEVTQEIDRAIEQLEKESL